MAASLGPGTRNGPEGNGDPFVTSSSAAPHQRFSAFDQQLFALGPGSSPGQAKRALESHLSEVNRRIADVAKLGQTLLDQRKEIEDQQVEVDKLQAEGELNPELRRKLAEIEKDFNDVERDTARALLPKQRVPSNEAAAGSPYVPEGRGGRRSVSPSKLESLATGSPTKFGVPNRKIRNQPSNRVHDIEFAAEISTSLIAQVRNLQSHLAEREEELRETKADMSRLEMESENYQQRIKDLDESETRYKDENWNLETQLHELGAQQKEAQDREKKMMQSLSVLTAEKSSAQRELDDVKLSHSKLMEEHEAAVKRHDIELGATKRSIAQADGERSTLRKKIDELTSQNQELAKAFSSQRGRTLDRDGFSGFSDEDFESAQDNATPEHSPPPSPVKGTPRHSMLESETLRSSFHHIQRQLQNQRSLLHREKTEKVELKRLLQDTRDELERLRSETGGMPTNRRTRKTESREFKKSPRLLGGPRGSRTEIFEDDPDWEDQGDASLPGSSSGRLRVPRDATDNSDQFETANETSDGAFETANERGTETEDFQTGAEELSGSDGAETETEDMSRGLGKMRRPPSLPLLAGSRDSFHSTASTSADEEDDFGELRTPTAVPPQHKLRLRVGRGGFFNRRSRQSSEEPFQSSPAGFANSSNAGTPQQAGQSLYAELAELEGSDDESIGLTPSRTSTRGVTPSSVSRIPSVPALPRPAMVDFGGMTDPVRFEPDISADAHAMSTRRSDMVDSVAMTDMPHDDSFGTHLSADSMLGSDKRASNFSRDSLAETDISRPISTLSYSDMGNQHDPDMEEKLARFPVPPTMFSPPSPPELSLSDLVSEEVEPVAEPAVLPRHLSMSSIRIEGVEPVAEPEAPRPELAMSSVTTEQVEPVAEPEIVPPPPAPQPELAMSSILVEAVEPVAEPEVVIPAPPPPSLPELVMSTIRAEAVEPVTEPEVTPAPAPAPLPELTLSSIKTEAVEPVAEPEVVLPPPAPLPVPELAMSPIKTEASEPVVEPEVVPVRPSLAFTGISSQHVIPRAEPEPVRPTLGLSSISSEDVRPVSHAKDFAAPNFDFTPIESIETRPVSPRSPKRDGFIIPRDMDSPFAQNAKPKPGNMFSSMFDWGRGKEPSPPVIAEDETRQSPRETPQPETPESQRPFKEISTNSNLRLAKKQPVPTTDQNSQTVLTSDAIDQLFRANQARGHEKSLSAGSIGTPATARAGRAPDSFFGASKGKGKMVDTGADASLFDGQALRRPGSSGSTGSVRGRSQQVPPLPANHREAIEAARTGSSHGPPTGVMGPPLMSASAMRNRPRTPSTSSRPMSAQSAKDMTTPRPIKTGIAPATTHGTADVYSPTKLTHRSRQSSVSSFASEIDSRFNIHSGAMGVDSAGFGPNTDPRMIQAITQTMIGEYLWKYTRKAGRGEMSEKRHRRYFWVHPYTRTLYWSEKDPSTAGRSELKAKSVAIEAVRVATDDNPMPPGLHRKSLVVISPARTIKFTCQTGQRHETWFNALSYLLIRTNAEGQSDAEEMAGDITREDVEEFNPTFGRTRAPSYRPRGPASLSSYNSRTTRNESPAVGMSMNQVPTLTPTPHKNALSHRPSLGSRISGYWSGTLSSMRSRTMAGPNPSIYEASEVHDSAEDLRKIIEQQDREADRLENVRACCDGKHDVGTLAHGSKRGWPHHSHSNPGPSASTPMSTRRTRA